MKRLVALPPPPSNFEIAKWKHTRFWAIKDKGGNLVTITVYRKGARELVSLLDRLCELERKFAGLHLIQDLIEPVKRFDMVADKPRR